MNKRLTAISGTAAALGIATMLGVLGLSLQTEPELTAPGILYTHTDELVSTDLDIDSPAGIRNTPFMTASISDLKISPPRAR